MTASIATLSGPAFDVERIRADFPILAREVHGAAERRRDPDQRQPLGLRLLALDLLDASEGAGQSLAAVSQSRRDAAKNKRKHEALAHPMVLEAFDIFPDARGKAVVRFEA